MSDLELNNRSNRIRNVGAIQYVANQMNDPTLDDKNTMEGIKRISIVNRSIRDAIIEHEEQKNSISNDNKNNPIVTAEEVKQAYEEGMYR